MSAPPESLAGASDDDGLDGRIIQRTGHAFDDTEPGAVTRPLTGIVERDDGYAVLNLILRCHAGSFGVLKVVSGFEFSNYCFAACRPNGGVLPSVPGALRACLAEAPPGGLPSSLRGDRRDKHTQNSTVVQFHFLRPGSRYSRSSWLPAARACGGGKAAWNRGHDVLSGTSCAPDRIRGRPLVSVARYLPGWRALSPRTRDRVDSRLSESTPHPRASPRSRPDRPGPPLDVVPPFFPLRTRRHRLGPASLAPATGTAGTQAEDLHRTLKARHLTMIALGGAIGTGLFVASGASIARPGRAAPC